MAVFLLSALLLVSALALHLAVWRIKLPKRQMPTLALVFGIVISAGLLGALWLKVPILAVAHAGLCTTSACLCYIIAYSAIEADSPTLSLIQFMNQHPEGLTQEALSEFLARRPFVRARLVALLQSELIGEQGGYYVLAGRPSLFFRLILSFRKLYGPIAKGG